MHTREELSQIFESYLKSLKFPSHPRELYEPIAYSLEDGGKRMRPTVVLMACQAFSDNVEDALPCAAAVEIFHNFTLLHDDIVDNADLRRGKASVHNKWGRNLAIISGDAMLIYSYLELGKTKDRYLNEVMEAFTKMALEVCEGQQMDLGFEDREDVAIDEYMDMIVRKTAVMFAAAAKMGAIIGGASKEDAEAFYEMGLQTGIAYQLQDDYLDAYGTPEVLGKNIGGDIAESKKTFLTINALNEAPAATRRALLATFKDDSHQLQQKINRVKTIYNSLDVPATTRAIISEHLAKASIQLDKASAAADRTRPLREFITSLENRNK